jgi:hypothetical protein
MAQRMAAEVVRPVVAEHVEDPELRPGSCVEPGAEIAR